MWAVKHRKGLMAAHSFLKHFQVGKFKTPEWKDRTGNKNGGTPYTGFKFSMKW